MDHALWNIVCLSSMVYNSLVWGRIVLGTLPSAYETGTSAADEPVVLVDGSCSQEVADAHVAKMLAQYPNFEDLPGSAVKVTLSSMGHGMGQKVAHYPTSFLSSKGYAMIRLFDYCHVTMSRL